MTNPEKCNIIIRSSVPDDAPTMRRCAEAAYQQYVERIGKSPAPMHADYASLADGKGTFVAEADGKVVVGLVVLVTNINEIWLDNVAVFPEYQGKGIGGRLIQFAEHEACRRGYSWFDLYTNEAMVENIEIYTHLGYVEISRRTEHGYRRVYMRKNLVNI
ncbi:MAG: GNAT family N-acetyltransferase [Candidatus Ratteibacteria bacterium]